MSVADAGDAGQNHDVYIDLTGPEPVGDANPFAPRPDDGTPKTRTELRQGQIYEAMRGVTALDWFGTKVDGKRVDLTGLRHRVEHIIETGTDEEFARVLTDRGLVAIVKRALQFSGDRERLGIADPSPGTQALIDEICATAPTGKAGAIKPLGGKIKAPKWLVPAVIPANKLIMLGGQPKKGKSTITRHLAAKVSAGQCAFGLDYSDPVKGKVILMSTEDDVDEVVRPGLMVEGADMNNVFTFAPAGGAGMALTAGDVASLRATLVAHPDTRLIIVDPVSSFVGRAGVDDNSQSEVRAALDPLLTMASELGVCVLIVAHLKKGSRKDDPIDRICGSGAYAAAGRMIFLFDTDPTDDECRVMVPVATNCIGASDEAVVCRQVEVDGPTANRVTLSADFLELSVDDRAVVRGALRVLEFPAKRYVDPADLTKRAASKVETCADRIRELLFAGPTLVADLDADLALEGYSTMTIRRAKQHLGAAYNAKPGELGGEWYAAIVERSTRPKRRGPFNPMDGVE